MVLLQHWTTHIWSAAKSILPFLFVIFITHLPYIVENRTETTLNANDAKLHKTITLALLKTPIMHLRLYHEAGKADCLVLTVKKIFVTSLPGDSWNYS
jgi:hypothetical protein